MPADAGARCIFCDEYLLEAAGGVSRKCLCSRAKLAEKFRHVIGLGKAFAVEVIAPAERNGSALAGETVEFELPKRQGFDLPQERLLFLGAQEVRLIPKSFRKSFFCEEIECPPIARHAILFPPAPSRRASCRPGPPDQALLLSSPCGADPAKASG
jgi:hypothetical protein